MTYSILNKDDFNKISSALKKIDYGLVLVHSDIFYGFKFNLRLSRQQLLEAHWLSLKNLVDEKPVWMPAFNYDFPKTKAFDIVNSKSQVGVLPEFFRTKIAKWRSPVPIFSFAGEDEKPIIQQEITIDPFDNSSLFHLLTKNNGLIIYYGAEINASTIIHYCERMSGVLCYRYDKFFKGNVCDAEGILREVILKYHVRPKNYLLEYDWELFERELMDNGVLLSFDEDKFHIKIIKANDLANYWISKMKADKLALLNTKTKQWVFPKLEQLGRAFQLSDFE